MGIFWGALRWNEGFPGGSVVKNPSANAGDASSIPGWERYPGGGSGNPLQYSYLENPMDRRVCRATLCRVTKESDMTESDMTESDTHADGTGSSQAETPSLPSTSASLPRFLSPSSSPFLSSSTLPSLSFLSPFPPPLLFPSLPLSFSLSWPED